MNTSPIDRRIAREAANWFVRLQEVPVSEQDRRACAEWRARHQDHERAWQIAQQFCEQSRNIPGEIGLPTLAQVDTRHQQGRRRAIKLITLLIVGGPTATVAIRTRPWETWPADIRTAVGEQRELVLDDGTYLHLNTDTAVDIDYRQDLRRVRLLGGELLVVTAPDDRLPARPFEVETRQGTLSPLGTRFNVRQFAYHSRVGVFEGAVRVQPKAAQRSARLNAGEQGSFDETSVSPALALPSQADDWTRGVLQADRSRLSDFTNELARYRPGILRCAPEVADLRLSGAFQLNNTDQVLASLGDALPVRVRYVTRYWTTIVPVA